MWRRRRPTEVPADSRVHQPCTPKPRPSRGSRRPWLPQRSCRAGRRCGASLAWPWRGSLLILLITSPPLPPPPRWACDGPVSSRPCVALDTGCLGWCGGGGGGAYRCMTLRRSSSKVALSLAVPHIITWYMKPAVNCFLFCCYPRVRFSFGATTTTTCTYRIFN